MGFCVSAASTVLSVSSSGPCTVTANTSLSLYGRQKQRYQTTCHSLSASSSAACGSGSSANLPSATAAHSWIGSHAKPNGATRTVLCSSLGEDRDRHGRADPSGSASKTNQPYASTASFSSTSLNAFTPGCVRLAHIMALSVEDAPSDPESSSNGKAAQSGRPASVSPEARRSSLDEADAALRSSISSGSRPRNLEGTSMLTPPTRRSGSLDEGDLPSPRNSVARRRSSRDEGDGPIIGTQTTRGINRRKGSRDDGDAPSTSGSVARRSSSRDDGDSVVRRRGSRDDGDTTSTSGTAARRSSRDDGDMDTRRAAGRRRGSRDDGDAPREASGSRASRGETDADEEEDVDPSMVRLGPRSNSLSTPAPDAGVSTTQSRQAAAEGEAVARSGNSTMSPPPRRTVMAAASSIDISSASGASGLAGTTLLMPGPSTSSRRSMQEAPAKLAQASTETLLFKPQAAPVVVPDLRMEVFAPAMALVPMAGNTVYLQTLTGMPVTTSQPIPLIGPLIISNSVQVFRDTDLVLPFTGASGRERLSFRLEYITCTAELATTLQVFNNSRQIRNGGTSCFLFVNGNQILGKGDMGVTLKPGDTISIGDRSITFQLAALPVAFPDPNQSSTALSTYLPSTRLTTLLRPPPRTIPAPTPAPPSAPLLEAAAAVAAPSPWKTPAQLAAKQARAMLISEDFRELAALSRSDPDAAEQQCRELVEAQRTCAGAWLLWAQIASRTRRPALARDLFREAANAAITLAAIPGASNVSMSAAMDEMDNVGPNSNVFPRRRGANGSRDSSDADDLEESPTPESVPAGDASSGGGSAAQSSSGVPLEATAGSENHTSLQAPDHQPAAHDTSSQQIALSATAAPDTSPPETPITHATPSSTASGESIPQSSSFIAAQLGDDVTLPSRPFAASALSMPLTYIAGQAREASAPPAPYDTSIWDGTSSYDGNFNNPSSFTSGDEFVLSSDLIISSSRDALNSIDPEDKSVDSSSGSSGAALQVAAGAQLRREVSSQRRPTRYSRMLMQVYFNWGKFEWALRNYGAARHLFRSAADETNKHAEGMNEGGGGKVLHYWAAQEYACDNIRNARIVVAEALRKCPAEAAHLALAAKIELAAATDLDMASAFCLQAYELDRTSPVLYSVWPLVEVKKGEDLRARLLFERALEYHPTDIALLTLYAEFEVTQGDSRAACDLYARAVTTDPAGPSTLAARAAWACIEHRQGNVRKARAMLDEGLYLHPRHVGCLVALAKMEKVDEQFESAMLLLRQAQQVSHCFDEVILAERTSLFRSMGEWAIADNLERHLMVSRERLAMKREGHWASEAWRHYDRQNATVEARAIWNRAQARRRELGWVPLEPGAKPVPNPFPAPYSAGQRPSHALRYQGSGRKPAKLYVDVDEYEEQEEEAGEYEEDFDDGEEQEGGEP